MDLSNLKIDMSAISAAAEKLKKERTAETKFEAKHTTTKRTAKTTAKSATKSTPKTSSSANPIQCSYIIQDDFKQRIEDYLKSRPDIADKLNRKDKSIDKCCEYLIARQYKIALKKIKDHRVGGVGVGVTEADRDTFGMAVHYFDESNEALEKELKGE